MTTLPAINDPIVVRDGNGRSYLSRVEDSTPGVLTLARPLDGPATDPFAAGAELWVTWTTVRGTAVLPVRLTESVTQGRVRVWIVAVLGDVWYEQRRAYVRVAAVGPMTLQIITGEDIGEPIPARLIDVSEGGLRCSVSVSVEADAENPFADDVEVVSRFRFRDTEFEVPGRVRAGVGGHSELPEGRAELIVLFNQPVKRADALRRHVFAEQIHQRRSTKR